MAVKWPARRGEIPSWVKRPTDAEKAAGITPVDLTYEPGHAFRYGVNIIGGDQAKPLQTWLDFANASNIESRLPNGTFLSSAGLTIVRPNNDLFGINIVGDGRGSSIIKYTGSASIGTLLDIDGTSSGWSLNNRISGLKLDVNDAPAGTIGLKINAGIWRSEFDDLYVTRDTTRTGTGIYMGSATPADVGCFDNKFSRLYVTAFSKNLHFQGTDLSGNTITNTAIDHSYISGGDYNLFAEFFNGMSANNTQYEAAVIAGAHFEDGETYTHNGGSIESAVGGAIGVELDANTKSVNLDCYMANNPGGHFIGNGLLGHSYRTASSGLIYPEGSEIRLDSDGTDEAYLRFFRNGVADVLLRVAAAGDKMAVCKADGTEQFKFDVTNRRLEVVNGSLLVSNATATATIIAFHGSPEGNVTAGAGSLCLDTTGGAGSSLYSKESGSGNTGWTSLGFMANLVDDLTPQLGGDLDLNSSDITGTGGINITGTVQATSYGGITEANLLDKSAAESITGLYVFNQSFGSGRLTGANTDYNEFHIRANSGKNAYISFTENAVADRWIIGVDAGDGTFRFASGNVLSHTDRMTLSNTGALTATSYGGITEANLVDKNAAETIVSGWSFSTILNCNAGLNVIGASIAAGSVAADFGAITGTSYGGIV